MYRCSVFYYFYVFSLNFLYIVFFFFLYKEKTVSLFDHLPSACSTSNNECAHLVTLNFSMKFDIDKTNDATGVCSASVRPLYIRKIICNLKRVCLCRLLNFPMCLFSRSINCKEYLRRCKILFQGNHSYSF